MLDSAVGDEAVGCLVAAPLEEACDSVFLLASALCDLAGPEVALLDSAEADEAIGCFVVAPLDEA